MTIRDIILTGSKFYNVPLELLKGDGRQSRIALARFSICAVCKGAGYSLNDIGRELNRHHSGIDHAVKQVCRERFGPMWESHERFTKIIAASIPLLPPKETVLEEIKRQIANLDESIAALKGTREELVKAKKLLAP